MAIPPRSPENALFFAGFVRVGLSIPILIALLLTPHPDQLSRTRSRLGVKGWIGHILDPAIATDGTPLIPNDQRVHFGPLVDPSPILPFPDATPCAVVNGSGSLAYPYILVIRTVP